MSTPLPPAETSGRRVLLFGLLWFVTYFAARGLLGGEGMVPAARVLIALGPIPFFAGFLWNFVQMVRGADEFERRIHLEALAVAFPLSLLLLMVLALMQRAVTLEFEDWSYAHVWVYLPIFYLGGLALARRRYL